MTRNRLLAAVTALIALVLAATVLSAPAHAQAHRAAALPAKPKVGQCRTTTFAQTNTLYDSRKPVPCSKPHRMKTFAVVAMPKSVNIKKINDAQISRVALQICYPRFYKALGSNHATRDQTAYTWNYFIPTKAARAKGQRWMRCDLSLLYVDSNGYGQWALLPNLQFPFIGTRAITDVTRRCLFEEDHDYVTTCNRKHVARADQTFTLNIKGFPSQATFDSQAASQCPGKRYTTPGKYAWSLGDHVVVCYSKTTS